MAVAKKKPKKIYMPGDLGDARTRREYRKSGPVITYKYMEAVNQMGDIIVFEDFLKLPGEHARSVLLELSKKTSDQKLAEAWSIHINLVRKLRSILGIQKDHSGTVTGVSEIQLEKWPPTVRMRSRKHAKTPEKVIQMPGPKTEQSTEVTPRVKGFIFTLEGIFNAEELRSRIDVIKSLIGSATNNYIFNISLEEIIANRETEETASDPESAEPELQEA